MKHKVGDLVTVKYSPCIYKIFNISSKKYDVKCIVNYAKDIVKDPYVYLNQSKINFIDISLEQYLFCLKNNLIGESSEKV